MKKTKLRKVSKKPTKKLKKLCDTLVKQIVKIRDNFTCQKCGKKVSGSDCQGSHVIPVSAGNKLAFDEMNLKVLCYHCHFNWWHKDPTAADKWFKEKFPERDAYLQANRGILQMKYTDFEELHERLKKRLEEILA